MGVRVGGVCVDCVCGWVGGWVGVGGCLCVVAEWVLTVYLQL